MPLTFTDINDDFSLGLWEITETPEDLMQQYSFSDDETEEYNLFTNDHRKKEWLASRLLVKQLTGETCSLTKNPDGSPVLQNSAKQISISHTSTLAAVLISNNTRPGIDVEQLDRNVEKVASRFLSAKELENCEKGNRQFILLLHWCGKEALFKSIPHKEITFAKQLHIDFKHNDTKAIECIYLNHQGEAQQIKLYHFIFEEHLIAYTFYP